MTYRSFGALLAAGVLSLGITGAAAAEIDVPEGFKVTVFTESAGLARHMAVAPWGDVYVNRRQARRGDSEAGVLVLRDTDGDGTADERAVFGERYGTGIAYHEGYLYVASDTAVYRWKLADGQMLPEGEEELIAGGFLDDRQHAAKTLAFDAEGRLYVNVGAPSNACMTQMRTKESPGQEPCAMLENTGGIWRFDAAAPDQDQMTDGMHYAAGIRHGMAIDFSPEAGKLFVVQHGRDQLDTLWPELYDAAENARLPAEEMLMLEEGETFGWPYTFWDKENAKRIIAPEYGGGTLEEDTSGRFPDPVAAFPGHWAPNDMVIYTGQTFPERMHGGAFVAFHGSWNRAPKPQEGYKVVFVPFTDGMPTGAYETFADGFTGSDEPIASPRDAKYRPTGLAVGPDGALYIADSREGRVWKVIYEGR